MCLHIPISLVKIKKSCEMLQKVGKKLLQFSLPNNWCVFCHCALTGSLFLKNIWLVLLYSSFFFAQGLLVLSDCRKKTAFFYFVVQISTSFHGKNRVIKKCKPSSRLAFVSFSREFLRPLFLFLKVIQIVTE